VETEVMIETICSCGERYEVKDALAGRRVRCLACSGPIAVPGGVDRLAVRVGAAPKGAALAVKARPRNRLAGAFASGAGPEAPRREGAALPPPPVREERREAARRPEAPAAGGMGVSEWAIAIGAAIGYAVIFLLYVL
jgi:hypothetical protein